MCALPAAAPTDALDIRAVQTALSADGLDGWLLYDFRGLNVLARRVLSGEFESGDTIAVDAANDALTFTRRERSGVAVTEHELASAA